MGACRPKGVQNDERATLARRRHDYVVDIPIKKEEGALLLTTQFAAIILERAQCARRDQRGKSMATVQPILVELCVAPEPFLFHNEPCAHGVQNSVREPLSELRGGATPELHPR